MTAAKKRKAWAIVMAGGRIDFISFKKNMGALLHGERYARVWVSEIKKARK